LGPKLCSGGDDGNLPVSCEDFEFKDENDDIPLSTRLSRISSLGTCSSKRGASIKKKPTTPGLVKRLFDDNNSNSLHISVKKSKMLSYDDQQKDENDSIRLSGIIKSSDKSTDKPFSSLKIGIALLEKSFEKSKRRKQVEEKRLKLIMRDIEECSRELKNKKSQVGCVRRITEAHDKMQEKIEECMKDFVVKEGQLYLMEDLIRECKHELETNKIELIQVKGKISKEIELRQVIA
jgi:hypothetical protein